MGFSTNQVNLVHSALVCVWLLCGLYTGLFSPTSLWDNQGLTAYSSYLIETHKDSPRTLFNASLDDTYIVLACVPSLLKTGRPLSVRRTIKGHT